MTPTPPTWPAGSFLAALSDHDRAAIHRLGGVRRYRGGERLIAQGAPDSAAMLILTGFVKIVRTSASGVSALLACRAAGDVIGELSAIDGEPRAASVLAVSPTLVRVIPEPAFTAYLAAHPDAVQVLLRVGAAKLREATRLHLAASTATAVAADAPDSPAAADPDAAEAAAAARTAHILSLLTRAVEASSAGARHVRGVNGGRDGSSA